jgi:hypothetical protein
MQWETATEPLLVMAGLYQYFCCACPGFCIYRLAKLFFLKSHYQFVTAVLISRSVFSKDDFAWGSYAKNYGI